MHQELVLLLFVFLYIFLLFLHLDHKFQEFLHSLYLKVVIALSILSAAIYGLWLLLNAWHGRNAPKKIRRH